MSNECHMKWTQLDRIRFQPNKQCQKVSQLNFVSLLTKNTNKVSSSSPLKHGHSHTGSYIFYTGHMAGNGVTTCKYEITLL